ncbi:GPP34 family phosphoprotein [Lentzea alba]|uniref:GOLPH3/VPS74 family protein n=1 Tax=Lentzea alba TaxID=2714351 RepID=UPI0039BFAA0F
MLLFINEADGDLYCASVYVRYALAGAVVVELIDTGQAADEKPQAAVERLCKDVRDDVMTRLEQRGVARVERSKLLGIFPRKRYVITDPVTAGEVRTAVTDVLRGGRAPDERTGALISLLHAVRAVHKVIDGNPREMNPRAKQIAAGDWANGAVRTASKAVEAALMQHVRAATSVSFG